MYQALNQALIHGIVFNPHINPSWKSHVMDEETEAEQDSDWFKVM